MTKLSPEQKASYESACKVLINLGVPTPSEEMWLEMQNVITKHKVVESRKDEIEEAFAVEEVEDVADMLGSTYKDWVTNIYGVVTSVAQNLDGSIDCLIQPKSYNGQIVPSVWVELSRLKKVGE